MAAKKSEVTLPPIDEIRFYSKGKAIGHYRPTHVLFPGDTIELSMPEIVEMK